MSNIKIIETGKIDTHKYMTDLSLSWFGKHISISIIKDCYKQLVCYIKHRQEWLV